MRSSLSLSVARGQTVSAALHGPSDRDGECFGDAGPGEDLRLGDYVSGDRAGGRESECHACDDYPGSNCAGAGDSGTVKTVGYSVSPNYTFAKTAQATLTGYTVTNSIQVTLNDLTITGKVIDTATQAGASGSTACSSR